MAGNAKGEMSKSSNLPAPTGGEFILEASVISILEHTAGDRKTRNTVHKTRNRTR
jgi:hypothetical protein